MFLSSLQKTSLRAAVCVVLWFCFMAAVGCKTTGGNAGSFATVSAPPSHLEQTPVANPTHQEEDCVDFIRSFPSTFKEFNGLYGYDDKVGPARLYSQYVEDITFFFECSGVPDSEKLSKAIGISINGKWDADGVSLFRNQTLEFVKKDPVQSSAILEKLSDNDAASFWYFMFDNPVPDHPENKKGFDDTLKLFGKDSHQGRLMKREYEKVKRYWSEDQ